MPDNNFNQNQTVVGRFAPSPTGPLHFGSLIAATASYLSARQHAHSRWLLRIEDVDVQRSHKKHALTIIDTLEKFGFKWDDEILYQSTRGKAYQEALDSLKDITYPCSCTRKFLRGITTPSSNYSYIYPGFCRESLTDPTKPTTVRLYTESNELCFSDEIQSKFCQNINTEVGDFILKRADGSFSYHLAVVVDDAWQGVNQIIRGADLLDSTPRQIYLQQVLRHSSYPQKVVTPSYGHFPVAITADGKKLSKQSLSPEISCKGKRSQLINALSFLGQTPPTLADFSNLDDLWRFAVQNWDTSKIPKALTKGHLY